MHGTRDGTGGFLLTRQALHYPGPQASKGSQVPSAALTVGWKHPIPGRTQPLSSCPRRVFDKPTLQINMRRRHPVKHLCSHRAFAKRWRTETWVWLAGPEACNCQFLHLPTPPPPLPQRLPDSLSRIAFQNYTCYAKLHFPFYSKTVCLECQKFSMNYSVL